jgi:hypothetical protein
MGPEGWGLGQAGAGDGVGITRNLVLVVVGAIVVGFFVILMVVRMVMLMLMIITLLMVLMLLFFDNVMATYMTVEVRAWILVRGMGLLTRVILQTPAKIGEMCVPCRDEDRASCSRRVAYKEECTNRDIISRLGL